jgi:hypothetical protein
LFLVLALDGLPEPGDGGAEPCLVAVVRAAFPDALVELVLQVGVPLGERVAGNAGLKGQRDDGQRAVGPLGGSRPGCVPSRRGSARARRVRESSSGVLSGSDAGAVVLVGRWPAIVAEDTLARLDQIRAAVGTQPDMGAGRAAEMLSARFGIPVPSDVLLELDRTGLVPCVGEYKGYPLYDGRALENFTDRAALPAAVSALGADIAAATRRLGQKHGSWSAEHHPLALLALSHGRGGGDDGTSQLMGLPPVLLLMAVPMPASHPLGLATDWETVNIPYPALVLVMLHAPLLPLTGVTGADAMATLAPAPLAASVRAATSRILRSNIIGVPSPKPCPGPHARPQGYIT